MNKVVITEFMNINAIDTMRQTLEVLYKPELADNQSNISQYLSDAEGLIVRNRTLVSQALLSSAPNLKVIGRLGVGLDNIDLDACQEKDIKVIPATGANNEAVAEYVITTAMMLLRNAYQYNLEIIQGDWPRQSAIGLEANHKTLGLIGFGAIAKLTAQKAQALGMRCIAYDPYCQSHDLVELVTSLDKLLSKADIVSLHVPLTKETRNLLDKKSIGMMKPNAVLINTSRGHIVDETALVEALKSQQIKGAALDVFANEPLTKADTHMFANTPNLILTPHIAGVTEESNIRVSNLIAKSVSEFLS